MFQYPNNQRATTLWYHDHALGMTRLNVYAGPAGFYLLRGGPDDDVVNKKTAGPATLPAGAYEIPIAIQDRSFNEDGSLFYPDITRQVSLNEMMGAVGRFAGPTEAMLGLLMPDGSGNPLGWIDPITENPTRDLTEVWEIFNFTADAHPIHIHQVMFQVVNRQVIGGMAVPPPAWETGWKDTVVAYPGQITRIKARFDIPGRFVWHCHIVEHEDNEMMRPFQVT